MAELVSEIQRLDPDEVKRRVDAGQQVVLVDVRSPEAFTARHIQGARSIPANTIVERALELPIDRDIVLY
jgi:rhodanese-related sulfurtransferase